MDSLRGLAVILMVQQHLTAWLWNMKWTPFHLIFTKHQVISGIHFAGCLAAPLFLILAGAGASMMHESGKKTPEIIKRGIAIILCGYLLNLITPNWFSPGSWYVLHTIGVSMILSPLLLRLTNSRLALLLLTTILLAALLQTWLNTALSQSNYDMNNISQPGGIARLMFVEGHFPLFPWLGFFMAGIIAKRLANSHNHKTILYAAASCIAISIILCSLYRHGYFFVTGGVLFRIFIPLRHFYPPLPVFIFFILGIALFLFFIFAKYGSLFTGTCALSIMLKATGRSSLSWFIIHVFIFNQLSWLCGFYMTFSGAEAFLIISLFIAAMLCLSVIWEKYNFKYGFEWIIRRMAAIKA